MGVLGQRRTAAATAIIMMLMVAVQYIAWSIDSEPARAAAPTPAPGTAVVDGLIAEWGGAGAFSGGDAYYFADLVKGPNDSFSGRAYLKYDCESGNLYVLVLGAGGIEVKENPDDPEDEIPNAWVKIVPFGSPGEDNGAESVVYDGDGNAIGFETIVEDIPAGEYQIEIHINEANGETNRTGLIDLVLECDDGEATTTTEGKTTTTAEQTTTTAGQTTTTAEQTTTTADGTTTTAEGTTTTAEGTTTTAEGTTTTERRTTTTVLTQPILSALGDYVWFDLDRDGEQDSDESAVEGVRVELLSSTGDVLATQITDENGNYLFDGLAADTYRVKFCLAGVEYTITNAGGVSDALDSDVFPVAGEPGCGLTSLINLPAGVTDLTWDAGILVEVQGIQIETTTTAAPTTSVGPVTVDTLPFTGLEIEQVATLAFGLAVAGALMLFAVGRREEPAAEDDFRGWTNH